MSHWQHHLFTNQNRFEPCRTCKILTLSEILQTGEGLCPECRKSEKSIAKGDQLRSSGKRK